MTAAGAYLCQLHIRRFVGHQPAAVTRRPVEDKSAPRAVHHPHAVEKHGPTVGPLVVGSKDHIGRDEGVHLTKQQGASADGGVTEEGNFEVGEGQGEADAGVEGEQAEGGGVPGDGGGLGGGGGVEVCLCLWVWVWVWVWMWMWGCGCE